MTKAVSQTAPRQTAEQLATYMKSADWKRKRALRLEIDRNSCSYCRATEHLEVHHKRGSYALIPNESVEHDLITLCVECHKAVHDSLRKRLAAPRKGPVKKVNKPKRKVPRHGRYGK